jgi:hypothetical protein
MPCNHYEVRNVFPSAGRLIKVGFARGGWVLVLNDEGSCSRSDIIVWYVAANSKQRRNPYQKGTNYQQEDDSLSAKSSERHRRHYSRGSVLLNFKVVHPLYRITNVYRLHQAWTTTNET